MVLELKYVVYVSEYSGFRVGFLGTETIRIYPHSFCIFEQIAWREYERGLVVAKYTTCSVFLLLNMQPHMCCRLTHL